MTLEEEIKHHEQIADSYKDTVPDCDCAKKHRQLAEWLRELKYYREECDTFKVSNIINPLKQIRRVEGTVKIIEKPKKIFE